MAKVPPPESGPSAPDHSSPDQFSSWKEIASYVGVSVRRAQQWEIELGLPVERFTVGQRARIRARRSEIDRWLRTRTAPVLLAGPRQEGAPPAGLQVVAVATKEAGAAGLRLDASRRTRAVALLVGTLLLSAAAWLAWWTLRTTHATPASAGLVNGELRVLDAGGRLLWRAGFREGRARLPAVPLPPEKAGLAWRTNTTLVHDLDADGRVEVLFVLSTTMGNGDVVGNQLICYGRDGVERWRYVPGRKTRWQDRQFNAAYSIWWVLGPFSVDGHPRLLVSASNAFFPCQVSLLDAATGRLVGEYWHFGALLSGVVLDADGDGRLEAILGGVNNPGPGIGSPALVELRLPLEAPRTDVATVFDPPRAREAAYLLFPPVDAFALDPYPAAVSWIRLDDWERLELAVSLGHNYPAKGQVYFACDTHLSVLDAGADDLLKAYHEQLRRDGQVDHRLDEREVQGWRRVRRFDTMPNANSRDVVALWEGNDGPGTRTPAR